MKTTVEKLIVKGNIMPRIITMHPVRETNRYGFETTQLYRAKVARNLNVDYLHLASAPQIRDNWKEDIKKTRFSR